MGVRTGNPRGRPRGAKNKRTEESEKRLAEAAKVISEAIPGAFEGDAHAFLMAVYKHPEMGLGARLDAAKAAVPYEKSRLASVEHTGADGGPIEINSNPRDVARAVLALLREAEIEEAK